MIFLFSFFISLINIKNYKKRKLFINFIYFELLYRPTKKFKVFFKFSFYKKYLFLYC